MIQNPIFHTFLYGTSIALMRGISLIMLPLMTHYLSPEEFGRVEILSSLTVIGSVLVGLGLEDSLYRFAGATKGARKRAYIAAQVFTLASVITVICIVLVTFLVPFIQPHIPGNIPNSAIWFALLIISFESMISVPLGWLRMQDQALKFFVATTGRVILQAGLTILFLQYATTVTSIFLAGLIAATLQLILLYFWQLQTHRLVLNRRFARKILTYSWPILVSGLLGFVLMGLDRWFIVNMSNLEAVAIYGVGAKFAIGVVLLLQPYTMWWSPKRFLILTEKGSEQTVKYISLGLLWCILACFVVVTGAHWVVQYIMPEQYHSSVNILWVLALAMLFKEAAELINIGCFLGKKSFTQMHINFFTALIGLIGFISLIPIWGPTGAAFALLIAQLGKFCIFYYYSQRALPLLYQWHKLSIFFVGMGICGVFIVTTYAPFEQLLLGAFISTLVAMLIINRFFPTLKHRIRRTRNVVS